MNSHTPKINKNVILKINRKYRVKKNRVKKSINKKINRVKKSIMGLHIVGKRHIDNRCSTPLGLITVVRKHLIAL